MSWNKPVFEEIAILSHLCSQFCCCPCQSGKQEGQEERVSQEWVDAILIPISKKGNLKCCDNWREISFSLFHGRLANVLVAHPQNCTGGVHVRVNSGKSVSSHLEQLVHCTMQFFFVYYHQTAGLSVMCTECISQSIGPPIYIRDIFFGSTISTI